MATDVLFLALLAAPAALAAACLGPRTARGVLRVCAAGTLALAAPAVLLARRAAAGTLSSAHGWLMADALSAWHLLVMNAVFAGSALYATLYFGGRDGGHALPWRDARRFAALWFGTYAAMALVLTSNNLATLWMGVEATTLLTAFMICIPVTPAALEAMWKYLVMCSVGVALAFAGVLLTAAAAQHGTALSGVESLQWTSLMAGAAGLNATLVKLGFVFLVVGFGVKAGLAPMHNWLPDAHGQAPAPVSALFSGFLLNAALYAILRLLPLAEAVTGNTGWARGILVLLGLLSVLVAAVFILAQRDVKRLLAYCSVEHIGVIAFGAGLGGAGAFAALFHILNHSAAKVLAFFCAGSLGRLYGTHDMRRMTGILRAAPVWGAGLTLALLALIGLAPSALFVSELLIVKAAWDAGAWIPLGVFLFGLVVVFAGISRHAIAMAWEPAPAGLNPPRPAGPLALLLVGLPSAALVVLGVWMPGALKALLQAAAQVLGGTP